MSLLDLLRNLEWFDEFSIYQNHSNVPQNTNMLTINILKNIYPSKISKNGNNILKLRIFSIIPGIKTNPEHLFVRDPGFFFTA